MPLSSTDANAGIATSNIAISWGCHHSAFWRASELRERELRSILADLHSKADE
jgi:hypothetical protein